MRARLRDNSGRLEVAVIQPMRPLKLLTTHSGAAATNFTITLVSAQTRSATPCIHIDGSFSTSSISQLQLQLLGRGQSNHCFRPAFPMMCCLYVLI